MMKANILINTSATFQTTFVGKWRSFDEMSYGKLVQKPAIMVWVLNINLQSSIIYTERQ